MTEQNQFHEDAEAREKRELRERMFRESIKLLDQEGGDVTFPREYPGLPTRMSTMLEARGVSVEDILEFKMVYFDESDEKGDKDPGIRVAGMTAPSNYRFALIEERDWPDRFTVLDERSAAVVFRDLDEARKGKELYSFEDATVEDLQDASKQLKIVKEFKEREKKKIQNY